ncbi:MAG: polysaccharide biosynthesis tyrosine autokinase [Vicinamibacteria bacterium]
MSQPELNLRDYVRILRKHRLYLVAPTLLLGLLTYLLTPSSVTTFSASSSVKISQSSTLAGFMLQVFTYSPGDTLATQTQIMTSLPLMARLAQHLGRIPPALNFKEIMEQPKLVAEISELQSMVSAAQVGNTSIIAINADAGSSDEAIQIVNGLADVFVAWSIEEKNRQVIEAKQFIAQQLEQVQARLRSAENDLQAFQENHLDQLSLSGDMMLRLQEERESIRAQITTLQLQVEQLKERGLGSSEIDWISSSELNNPTLERFNAELIDLQLQKERLLVYQTEASPEVRVVENKIQTLVSNLVREYVDNLVQLEQREATLNEKLALIPQNDAELARLRRNTEVASEAYTLLKSKHEEASIREAEKIREADVVEYAMSAVAQSGSGKASKSLVGALIGLVLGFVWALVAEGLDTSIGTIEDVESYLQVPVLGVIPHINREEVRGFLAAANPHLPIESLDSYSSLVAQFDPKSPVAESYRSLRTNLEFTKLASPARSFLVTSSTLEEGKSTTVANLGLALAQGGKRTLIVESDLRRPSIYNYFGLTREPGLTEVLLGTIDWKDALRSIADVFLGKLDMDTLVRTPGLENLFFITSGTIPPNPAELLGSGPMRAFIERVTEEFDVILFDSPPALPVTDAAILATQVDAVVLIYQMGRAGRGLLKRAKSHMDAVRADIRGVVLNDIKAEVSEFSPAEYYYQYYAADSSRKEEPGFVQKALGRLRSRAAVRKPRPSLVDDASGQGKRPRGGAEYEDILNVTGGFGGREDAPKGRSER